MKTIEIAPRARADLDDIRTWIAKDNASAAVDYLDGIRTIFRHLADWPMSGRNHDDIRPGLRSFGYRSHMIFYRPTASGVSIVRVIHGRRDLGRIFQ